MYSGGPAVSRMEPRYKTHMGELGRRKEGGERRQKERMRDKGERTR